MTRVAAQPTAALGAAFLPGTLASRALFHRSGNRRPTYRQGERTLAAARQGLQLVERHIAGG